MEDINTDCKEYQVGFKAGKKELLDKIKTDLNKKLANTLGHKYVMNYLESLK